MLYKPSFVEMCRQVATPEDRLGISAAFEEAQLSKQEAAGQARHRLISFLTLYEVERANGAEVI
jgi:hypothetical protein